MNHLFVPYEIALLAKEKRFNEPCFGQWRQWDGRTPYLWLNSEEESDYYTVECEAPLYQQLIDWFFEKHEIHISTFIQFESEVKDYPEEGDTHPEEIIHSYRILNLPKMRKNKDNFLPYVETDNFLVNAKVNTKEASLIDALTEAFKLI